MLLSLLAKLGLTPACAHGKPVVTNAAMIADSDGNMRPSKMVVRLVRPWSKDFDQKMQRYVKKMERMGRSQMEQNAFIANVMEVFNKGNTLLLDDSSVI